MIGLNEVFTRIWNGTITEQKKPEAKIAVTNFTREQPEQVTFERIIRYHDQTPQIQLAVSSYSELISGTDMVVSAENDQAKELIEEWIRKTNFYDKFEGLVQTLLITGNALLERLDPRDTTDVEEVDMGTIVAKKRDEFGKLQYYEQRQQSGRIVKLGEGKLDRFIEFNLTHYSKQPWGRSLFYSLAVPRTVGNRTTAPLVEILWGMEDAMAGIILNNAYPITTITYEGANDKHLERETERWRRYKPGDKRVQKEEPKIEFHETQPGSKYTDYVNHIEKAIELGTQFPHDIMTGDFTSRASSETTETIVMKKVRGFQRYLCNKLKKELFEPILEQQGINTEEAKLEISFVAQNIIELKPEQVSKLFTDKAITVKELRDWYRENTGIDLPDDEIIRQMHDIASQQQDDFALQQRAFDSKVTDLESKINELKTNAALQEKVQGVKDQMEDKLNLIKKAIDENNQGVAQTKIRALESWIRRLEDG